MSENNHHHLHHQEQEEEEEEDNHCSSPSAAAAAAETMSEDDDEPGRPHPPPDPGSKKTRNCAAVHPSPHPDRVLEIVLEHVLQFLSARRDRNAASLVCKCWYRTEALTRPEVFIGNCYSVSPSRVTARFPRVRSVAIKGRPRFADFNLMPQNWGAHFGPWVATMGQAYPWLERVYLKRMSLTDRDLCLLAESFGGFKELVLVCCDGFGTGGLAAIASKCRQLRVLDLSDTEVGNDGVDWISFFPEGETCLESLIFDCVECPINFEALESLVARSPSLKKLRLNRDISIQKLYRLMVRAPNLTHLGTGAFGPLEPQAPNDQEFDYASAFSACKSLVCLSGFREIAPEYLPAFFPACPNLTSLNLSYANIDVEQFKSIICQCRKLQVLWVLDSICDEGLQAVAATCNDLRELRVFPLDPQEDADVLVSEIGFQAISEGCPKLQSILYFCQRMTNAAVIAMSKNCPELVVFRLCIMGRHRPDHITGAPMDEGFGAIVMNCKKLTRLAISGLLTDRAFGLIGKYGKLVRTLSVAFAGDSDSALKYVLEGCPNLQKLEIRDSPFGDSALLSGFHHYYNMRFLWMSSCHLSRQGCQQVARTLPRLVVELLTSDENEKMEDDDAVDVLYMYRSLDGPRDDRPEFVTIL